ncbi:MAG: APC family permease [Gammaproteobacteria bacterium]
MTFNRDMGPSPCAPDLNVRGARSATPLKRSLGLWLLTLYGLGNILGAGIYVLVGKVVHAAGMYGPIAFLIASLVAAVSAFTYAELSARHPVSAGEAVYVDEAFDWRALSVAMGLLIGLAGMVSAATLSRGFVGYFQVFAALPDWLLITALVAVLAAVAVWGITESVRVAGLFTLVEIGGLLLIIAVAGDSLGDLPARWPELVPPAQMVVWHGVFLGAFLAFYAFLGFEDMVNVAEEVEKPQRTLPLAIFLALTVSATLYILVVLVAVLTLSPAILGKSEAPLALVYTRATGAAPIAISGISLFAIVNGVLIQIIMVARILYGMSSNGWLPSFLSRVHSRTRTPIIATLLAATITLTLALFFPLVKLAASTSFLLLTVFGVVNLALIRLKLRDPHPRGIKTYPMWVPVAGAVSSLALLSASSLFLD